MVDYCIHKSKILLPFLVAVCFLLFIRPTFAASSFEPTGGYLGTGTEAAITSGGTSGNVGSWRGTLAQDATAPGWNWTVNTNASTGLDQQLNIDNVSLSGANKMMIIIRAMSSSTSIVRNYQICDWVSTANVDTAADGTYCTGGGWRTLNIRKATITAVAITNYTWHIYDGYWTTSTTGNTPISTPLTNFVKNDSTKRVLIRAYSTSAFAGTHTIDWARVSPVIDTMYSAANFTQITGGSVVTSYINTTNAVLTGQSGSDATYLSVPGTAGAVSNFYLSYTNVKTYVGMNTILVVSNYGCTTTGINIMPKIYNFTTTSWVNLTTSTIACSATQATGQFAVNNITMTDYIQNGEIRVAWVGSANNVLSIRLDYQYILLGTTNSDTGLCEVSFGTTNATTCSNTRDIDSTLASPVTWQQTTELESTTMGHDYYAGDNDGDATSGEAAASSNLSFNITPPSNASVVNLGYAMRWRSNSTTITTTGEFKDNQGDNPTIAGGWTAFGTTNLATTYTYEDHYFNNLPFGNDPKDYIDQVNDRVNVRIRTSAATATANVTRDIDFVMVTFSWREDAASIVTLQSAYEATGGYLGTGTAAAITSGATSGNTGSWKGTLAQDATSPGWNWTVNTNGSTGLDQQLNIDNVALNGANKMQIVIRAMTNSTSISRLYQICDWVSTANVDAAADGTYCTGGGWRTLNIRKAALTAVAITNYTWHIYDGYWTTSTTGNTPVSTPLTNFVKNDSTKRVLIRAYSASAFAGTHTIDWARVQPVIDSMYSAANFTQTTGGSVVTSYINTTNALLTGQSGSDATYLSVPGTAGAIADFYLSYKNIKTYTGMNTILVVSNYGCSTTGINIMPKIYNFTTTSWVNLTTSTIACSTTQATGQFAVNNITLSDYVNAGEVRVGWFGSANNVLSIRLDYQYILLGTTNSDTGLCETSFGTANATTCSNTRDIDSTLASPVTWQQTTELESTTMSHDYYANDNDGDATSGEAAASSNLGFNVTPISNGSVVTLGYSLRWRSNSTTITTTGGFKDNQGDNPTVKGGWTDFGTTNLATTYTYEDYIFNNLPFANDAKDYLDRVNNRINMKIRTSTATAVANVTRDIDFAMVTLTWLEGPSPTIEQEAYRLYNNLDSTDVGTVLAAQNTAGTITSTGGAFRLRALLHVAVAQVPINSSFKLQFAGKGLGTCASPSGTPSSYTDVTTGTVISYKNNATPTDGTVLTVNANDPTSTNTISNQTYEELNNFSNSISAIPEAYAGKWDFALYDNSAPAGTTYCLRIVESDSTLLDTYTTYPEITTASANVAPNSPSSLVQAKTDDTVITVGGWINQSSVKFSATASDTNNPDTLALCVEKKAIANAFTNAEDTCGTPVAYSGTPVTITNTIISITDATEYHWQARVKDTGGLYSAWVSYGANLESVRDFGVDTTAPTALSVYDGTTVGSDVVFNDGSLSALSANWGTLNANVSGLLQYEYSIGTTAGATDVKTWTNVTTTTAVTASGLTLQSSQLYYFNIRVSDNAGNTAIFSSDGQKILPSLSFSLSNSSVAFSNLNNGNSFSNTQTTTLTTTTNAYNGYVVRLFKADSMRSVLYPTITIGDFNGGTYANPGTWGAGNYGFGYNSNDTTIQGVDKFNAATCPGGGSPPCFAPFSSTAPGDIVADHTANVTGSPISAEQFIITYKIKTTVTQTAGPYGTTLVYTIIPQY